MRDHQIKISCVSVIEIVCVCVCVCVCVKFLLNVEHLLYVKHYVPNAGCTVLRRLLVPALPEPVVEERHRH